MNYLSMCRSFWGSVCGASVAMFLVALIGAMTCTEIVGGEPTAATVEWEKFWFGFGACAFYQGAVAGWSSVVLVFADGDRGGA